MRGASGIPLLRNEVLQGLVTSWMTPPNLILQAMFPSPTPNDSDTITWESKIGSRGLSPIVPPGTRAPRTDMPGVASHSAKAAYIKEKIHLDEEHLNNLREPGTRATYYSAARQLVEAVQQLQNRTVRRREWLLASLITSGTISYESREGVRISVDYGIPTAHNVTLAAASKWNTGSSRDILGDITDGRKAINQACGAIPDVAILNSTTLEYIANDPLIRTILQKNAFGDGTLFKADQMGALIGMNAAVISNVLNLPKFLVYDEQYQISAEITGAVAAGATSITVDDATNFVAGETLRLYDKSAKTYEDVTISTVSQATDTLTVSATTYAYKAFEDYVTMTKYFIPDNKFIMMASSVDGQKVIEQFDAPYGINRNYGMKVDTNEEWDPEGVDVRIRDKTFPVLKQRDAIYIIDVE